MISWHTGSMIALVVMLTAAPRASAFDVTLFEERDTFLPLVEDAVLETFEDESLGALPPGNVFSGSGLGVAIDADGWDLTITESTAFSYNTTVPGSKHFRIAFGAGDYTVSFLGPDMTAFGFDLTGYQDLDEIGGFDVALFDDDILIDAFFVEDPGDFDAHFHGIISDQTFDRVDVTVTATDIVGFDDVVFGMGVPAPGAVVLLVTASIVRRRRRAV